LASSHADPDQSWQHRLRVLNAKGGERKRLTVLFADIGNSTSLIDSLGDPELGMQRMQPVLNLMNDAVHRYEGVVNKSQGDGVMALFGAPALMKTMPSVVALQLWPCSKPSCNWTILI
jgi:adenylate cyclase